MRKAAGKESAIAIEEGNVDAKGIPCITVIVDGSWGKRSYNMNSTFIVAMACITGQTTNEHMNYTRVVGDGDSTVMEKLRTKLPYCPETEIDKIECTNHLLGSFGKKIRAIQKEVSLRKFDK
ncbi:hypothetical protein ILUMI_20215 [Ignelater luminosus]|uniref:Mutator-like transposase domain-containing protein n=1 Tax=Ignelater luminosus TaxID=2038154 RepID=A0A8K0G2H7_IGNLU|nr:hypothetical protein ILUMI_20215 [Ignelater luminosus]